MKLKIILCVLILVLANVKIYSIKSTREDDSVAKQLFVKSEKIAILNRKSINKVRFLDPIGNNELFYKILKKESPELFYNTNRYKFGILKLLSDCTMDKDYYTDSDIINLLCNLCLNNYIVIIDSVRKSVVNGRLKFSILERIIFQDFNLSNQVARNYKDPHLQKSLQHIKQDIEIGKILIPKDKVGFISDLNRLISGEYWEKELKQENEHSPPLLNPQNCR